MESADGERPLTPDDGRPAARSSWPVTAYVGALLWAVVTLGLFTWETSNRQDETGLRSAQIRELNTFRLRVQGTLLALAAIRLAWAVSRRETGYGWWFYVILLLCAAPIWLLIEHSLAWMTRLSGGG